jgi:hypothetical protein
MAGLWRAYGGPGPPCCGTVTAESALWTPSRPPSAKLKDAVAKENGIRPAWPSPFCDPIAGLCMLECRFRTWRRGGARIRVIAKALDSPISRFGEVRGNGEQSGIRQKGAQMRYKPRGLLRSRSLLVTLPAKIPAEAGQGLGVSAKTVRNRYSDGGAPEFGDNKAAGTSRPKRN